LIQDPPRTRRGQAARNALVEQYLPLVRHVVARLPVTPPRGMDRDDLQAAGVVGLIQAAETWDPARGASFKTFAYTAIRGAVLDEIRRHDPVPRPRRERLRAMERASSDLREILGRTPTIEEIAERIGVRAADLDEDLDVLHGCRTVSLDDLAGTGRSGDDEGHGRELPSGAEPDPARNAERHDQLEALAAAIGRLPEQERRVVVLYHHEGLYMKEIGDLLGVTESRVCQVLAQATRRLRQRLRDQG
jgi:RNA polymerase sigma factor for flagellar operon FliA